MCDVPFLARAAQKSNLVPSVPGNTTNPISSENVLVIQRGPEFERRGRERCSVFGAAQGHWVINHVGDLYMCVCAVQYHKWFLYHYQSKSLHFLMSFSTCILSFLFVLHMKIIFVESLHNFFHEQSHTSKILFVLNIFIFILQFKFII